MSEGLPLPLHPSIEQYKKIARDLQDACKSGGPNAIRHWAARWLETLARLEGAAGWSAPRDREREVEEIEQRWNKLRETNEHSARCTLAGAQFFIAREHGFGNWPKFGRHVRELARANSPVSAFETAADAIINGDAQTVRTLLAEHPGLVRERSTREHRSTLLHYVAANGVEGFRQKTPKNIVEIANLLLDAGADVDAESDAYGGGCTALGLVATSCHPEEAGVQIALLQALLDRGARFDQPLSGGNDQSLVHACIANGQPNAARFFADLGAPLDLESAAALGSVDVLTNYLDGSLTRQPHPGRKQIESAFLYACGNGSAAAAEFLLGWGIDLTTRNEDGQTGLHCAAWGAHIDVIGFLIERGAPVDAKDKRFHAQALDMALWKWDNSPHKEVRDRCYAVIALLAQAGAKLDRDHWRDPQEDGSAMLRKIDSDARMLVALRGEMPQ